MAGGVFGAGSGFRVGVGHGAGGLVSVLRGFAAGGPWAVILLDLGTFLVFCNFLRS